MKKLLNTLFVTTEDAYLSLDGENVVVNREKQELARFPLHTLSGIIAFTYAGASPALMGACAKRDIALSFCTPRGRFLARCVGETTGNVLLRRMQYRAADDPFQSCRIARNMIFGKLHNARWSIERTKRDHGLRVDVNKLQASIDRIKGLYPLVMEEISLDSLRGEEGAGAQAYFDVFDDMILRSKDEFYYRTRSRNSPSVRGIPREWFPPAGWNVSCVSRRRVPKQDSGCLSDTADWRAVSGPPSRGHSVCRVRRRAH